MPFIRIKTISQKPYAYVVESTSTSAGPRQKVKQYLGRVYEFEERGVEGEIDRSSKKAFIQSMVHNSLLSLGFEERNKTLECGNLVYTRNSLLKKNGKEAIVKLHDGYLCSFTINRLLKFRKSSDLNKDAQLLAKYFLEAGLLISQEDFVEFYELL